MDKRKASKESLLSAGQPARSALQPRISIRGNVIDNHMPLEALITKYRYHAEFEERDLTDINHQPYPDADLLIHLVARVGSPDELDLPVKSGARVNAAGDMGFTALHNAAMVGRIKLVEKLLMLGADPKIRNEWGNTPEEMALNGGHMDVAKLLTRHKHHK